MEGEEGAQRPPEAPSAAAAAPLPAKGAEKGDAPTVRDHISPRQAIAHTPLWEEETCRNTALGLTLESHPTVIVLANNVGNAPILSQNEFRCSGASTVSRLQSYIQTKIRTSPNHADATVHIFINKSFSPAPDEILSDLYKVLIANPPTPPPPSLLHGTTIIVSLDSHMPLIPTVFQSPP